jgi:bifunctional DNA-binding transcriptional regulator/antitoxin component of YhaV-PrlF toxin-antitoxin module
MIDHTPPAPYSKESLLLEQPMIAKMTSKNQLTLPKAVTEALGTPQYFDIETRGGQLILTPVQLQRTDALRERIREMGVTEKDVKDAVAWARRKQK